MEKLLGKFQYEELVASSRDERMGWWRDARFGMFVHFGLYSSLAHQEWAMSVEDWAIDDYEKLTEQFLPKPGAPREWAALAKKAGMKYMVLTTRHHEGFSLWDSKVNPYNSVNYGPKRDIVREFVDACREFGLKIGFYSSLMDWHHPDGWKCAYDSDARKRFTDYIIELNRELMTNYGKIDILWYDVANPMATSEGWNSLELNQMVRSLQPEIIINNRSHLDEDFGTPEGAIVAQDRDWEACMTFNDISWGYIDSEQAAPFSYNAQRIIKMLHTVTASGGNLLLNIGPMADGSIPKEAIAPLEQVGNWLAQNGSVVYGKQTKSPSWLLCSGLCACSVKETNLYLWNWIWPAGGCLPLGGIASKLKKAVLVKDQTPIAFEQNGDRVLLKGLPAHSPDSVAGIAVIELQFEEVPVVHACSYFPQVMRYNYVGDENPNVNNR